MSEMSMSIVGRDGRVRGWWRWMGGEDLVDVEGRGGAGECADVRRY